jgi:hypothetical protein
MGLNQANWPMQTNLTHFRPGSRSPLTYRHFNLFIAPVPDGRHIHPWDLSKI